MGLLFLWTTCALLLFIEATYSFFKKDGVYSKKIVAGNIGTFFVLSFLSQKIVPAYFSYWTLWSFSLYHNDVPWYAHSLFATVLAVDFVYYLFHRMLHASDVLFRFHAVHHSDEYFNVSTSLRISIVEHLGSFLFFSILFLAGFDAGYVFTTLYILGVYQFITHSSYIRFPNSVSSLFVTPKTHKIHHSKIRENQNSNFGGIFSFWDRLFLTFQKETNDTTIGITGYQEDNPLQLQLDPFLRKPTYENKL